MYITLILNPLTWKIWWAPNNASRWQIAFQSAFKGLKHYHCTYSRSRFRISVNVE